MKSKFTFLNDRLRNRLLKRFNSVAIFRNHHQSQPFLNQMTIKFLQLSPDELDHLAANYTLLTEMNTSSSKPLILMSRLVDAKNGAKGFFVEGFGKYVSGDVEFFSGDDEVLFGGDRENFNDFSLGMSVGQKWVNSNGLVVELLVGVSRTLGGDSGNEGYFRGGVFVGYRF